MQHGNNNTKPFDSFNRLLTSRSRYGVFAYMPFWLLFSLWSGDFQTLSTFFTVNTILLVFTAVAGYVLITKVHTLSSYNQKLLVSVVLFRSLHWGAISAYMLYQGLDNTGLTSALLIMLMIFASGGIALLSFNSVLGLSHALLMVTPTAILGFFEPGLLDPKFIILAALVFLLLFGMNKGMNQDHLSDFKQTEELYFLASSMENLSKIDYLTQTYNRFGFSLEFEKMWRKHLNSQQSICLLFLTVDQLSTIRRNNGYQTTEECIKKVAALLKDNLKPSYVLGLYGSEEFMIALPESSLIEGVALANQLNKACQMLPCRCNTEKEVQLTTSIGITSATPNNTTNPETLLLKADQALSQAKSQGGNGYHAIEL